MTNVVFTFATLIALALLVGAGTLLLLWLLSIAHESFLKSRNLTIAFVAAIAALASHPATAFIAAWIIVLLLTKVAYVNTRTAFKRVGTTSTRLQATQEVSSMFFLFALACIALQLSLGYAVLAALIVWPTVNAIAMRREWPLLMRTAGR